MANRRSIVVNSSAAGTVKWTADQDVLYVGSTLCATAASTNVVITTDAGLTRALFVAPTVSGVAENVVDYLENSQQTNARFTGDRRVFLPVGTSVYFIASAQMALIVWLEDVTPQVS